MGLLFALLVVAGFIAKFIATFPNTSPWAERLAWGFWLAASIIWAIGPLNLRAG